MGYCYDTRTGARVCDSCGSTGSTRLRKCPAGWCPAAALCATCWREVGGAAGWRKLHPTCAASAAEADAARAMREADPGRYVQSALTVRDRARMPAVALLAHDGAYYVARPSAYDASRGCHPGTRPVPADAVRVTFDPFHRDHAAAAVAALYDGPGPHGSGAVIGTTGAASAAADDGTREVAR